MADRTRELDLLWAELTAPDPYPAGRPIADQDLRIGLVETLGQISGVIATVRDSGRLDVQILRTAEIGLDKLTERQRATWPQHVDLVERACRLLRASAGSR